MADIAQTITYSTGPTITFTITYETQRSGNTVSVRFKTVSNTLTGSSYYGYNIQGQPTTKGTLQTAIQIKASSPNQWSTPITTYYPSSTGWYTMTVNPGDTSADCSIRFYSTNGGGANVTAYGTVSFPIGYTNPVRGNISFSPTGTFESVTISWDSFQNGTGNPIIKYEVWYQESSNNSSWGGRIRIVDIPVASGTTSGSYTWSGGTRGYYYRFNVIAAGTVTGTYSATEVYTSSVRKNQAPNPPTNVRYNSPTIASNGTSSSSKLYIPESSAGFLWDNPGDPDGGGITFEVQAYTRNAANTGWVTDGALYIETYTYSYYNISAKPRGSTNALVTVKESLWFQVHSKDSFGVISAWVGPYHGYQRNPTIINAGVSGNHTPGIVYVGINGSWIKAEVYTGVNGVWKSGLDKDY